jgi:pseudouridine-5'-phosphate glycosidase/pseudouridine kinase
VILDANWKAEAIQATITDSANRHFRFAYEPVSAAKAGRLFQKPPTGAQTPLTDSIFPNHAITLSTPNVHELRAMYDAAAANGYFDTEAHWLSVDSLGIPSSGIATQLNYLCGPELVEQGIPQMAIRLLPYIPILAITLGERGVLLVRRALTPRGSSSPKEYMVSEGNGVHGGVSIRLYSPAQRVDKVISVNGAGDTFLGALVAHDTITARQGQTYRPIRSASVLFAQECARLSLMSEEAVSPGIADIRV